MNKRERHKMYKRALERLDKDKWFYGLCCCIYVSVPTRMTYAAIQNLPEVKAQKPKREWACGYWWPLDEKGYKKRRQVLLKCIEQTKRK